MLDVGEGLADCTIVVMPTLALHDEITLPVSRAVAWSALHDLSLLREMLAATHPGARLSAGGSPHSYQLEMPAFQGLLLLLDLEAPNRLRLSFDGRGPDTGQVQGQAQCRLELMGDQRTLLHWSLVVQTERQPGGFRLKGIAALKTQLKTLQTVVQQRLAPDVPVPAPQPKKPWPQRLADWYLGWFAAMFNGTLYPLPKPKQRPQDPKP